MASIPSSPRGRGHPLAPTPPGSGSPRRLFQGQVATALCPPEFTISELRRVYEVVWGGPLDPRNFHRKATKTDGFLLPTDRTTTRDGGRPARLYRAGRTKLLYPPLLRVRTT
jgi:8-oxo-dGTP diphosphatase